MGKKESQLMAGNRGRSRLARITGAVAAALLVISVLPGIASASVAVDSVQRQPTVVAPAVPAVPAVPVTVTFYKEICSRYSDVPANGNPGTLDEATRGHSGDLNTSYGTTGHIVSPSSDIPAACAATSGWSFYFTNSGGTATTGGPFTTGPDGSIAVTLSDAELALAQSGTGLWVREATSNSAGFGSIRCYNDILNGDNLEQMTSIGSTTQLYCVAYNVRQVITFDPLADKTYGDGPITLSATATSGLPVSFAASGQCSLSGTTLSITGTGSCSVTASQDGRTTNPFWSPALDVVRSFNINPVPVTVTADNKSRAFGAANPAFTYGTSPVVSLTTPASCTSTATVSSPVGTDPITCSGGVLANYSISYVAGTLTINPVGLTVTADNQTRAFGAADPAFTDAITGFVGSDTAASLTTQPTCTSAATASSPVGTYPITCWGGASTNYTFSYVAGTLTITPAALTVAADNKSRAFGAANPAFTYGTSPVVSLTTPASCTSTATVSSPVGTYPITCSGGVLANYDISYVAGTLTVSALPVLTVTADNQTRAFGAADPAFTDAITGFVGSDTAAGLTTQPTCTSTATASSPVGTYPITCLGAASATYNFSYVTGTLTITPAALTVTANDATRAVGASDPAFTFITSPVVSLTTPATCTTTATASSPVGTYPITCSGAVLANYDISYVAGTLTVSALPILTVTADNQTRALGATDPAFTDVIAGFVGSDTAAGLTTQPTCTSTATAASPVGTYPITCSGGASADYSFSYVAGTLSVTAATVTPTEEIGGASATPSTSASHSQALLGVTSAPNATPPATNAANSSSGDSGMPLFALLIALAFGSLAMLMVEKQRRAIRN
jgi:hypothetical protein